MQDPHEARVNDESKLMLHGLLQYHVKLDEKAKNCKSNDLHDSLEFFQTAIFVKSVQPAVSFDNPLM
eukprot:15495020-Heterocapsa_arctica.AAC.1